MNQYLGTRNSLFLSDELINKISQVNRQQLESLARHLFWEFQIREPERAKQLEMDFTCSDEPFQIDLGVQA